MSVAEEEAEERERAAEPGARRARSRRGRPSRTRRRASRARACRRRERRARSRHPTNEATDGCMPLLRKLQGRAGHSGRFCPGRRPFGATTAAADPRRRVARRHTTRRRRDRRAAAASVARRLDSMPAKEVPHEHCSPHRHRTRPAGVRRPERLRRLAVRLLGVPGARHGKHRDHRGLVDLTIALSFVAMWMWRDARRRGIIAVPYWR